MIAGEVHRGAVSVVAPPLGLAHARKLGGRGGERSVGVRSVGLGPAMGGGVVAGRVRTVSKIATHEVKSK